MAPPSHQPEMLATVQTDERIMSLSTAKETSNRVSVGKHNMLRPLHCEAQKYDWGRLGSSSLVARLKDAQAMHEYDDLFEIDESEPYAELWLGTHPNGMSRVTVHHYLQHGYSEEVGDAEHRKCSLLEYVQTDPSIHCGSAESNDLPFLLKVLSVRKVLSIQAHPDKKLAEQLHAERPDIYKDPNHKPEMAIALSEKVKAMCGFRSIKEIALHLDEYPEFASLVGSEMTQQIKGCQNRADVRQELKDMFHGYIDSDPAIIHEHVEMLVSRLQTHAEHDDIQKLILQLYEQFPGDCGVFAPLIFNIVDLSQGEGLFIEANEPHAYVSGDILECMACSDNVVRAGLTPKLKDVPTLVNMLTYKCRRPDTTRGTQIDACTARYQPPVEDFCVEILDIPRSEKYEIQPVDSPSVLLVLDGDASLLQDDVCSLDVSFGSAAFCSANTHCTVTAGPYGVRLTRAFTNVFHQQSPTSI